jgi:hypothetical protein
MPMRRWRKHSRSSAEVFCSSGLAFALRRAKLALCLKPILISSAITTPTRLPQRVSKSGNIFMRRHDCALWVKTLFASDALTPRGWFPFEYSTSFRRADDHSHYYL